MNKHSDLDGCSRDNLIGLAEGYRETLSRVADLVCGHSSAVRYDREEIERLSFELIRKEYERAIETHGDIFNSPHEGYAVLLEEVDELWAEIKRKDHLRSRENLIAETAQAGAMAVKLMKTILVRGGAGG